MLTRLSLHGAPIAELAKSAWKLVKDAKAAVWRVLFYQMIIVMLVLVVALVLFVYSAPLHHPLAVLFALLILLYGLMTPLAMSTLLLGVRRARGESIVNYPIFKWFKFSFIRRLFALGQLYWVISLVSLYILLVAALLIYFYWTHGYHFLHFILLGLWLVIGCLAALWLSYFIQLCLFALMLQLDQNMSAWVALTHTQKRLGKEWFKLLLAYSWVSGLVVLSALPLGIGLIWTVPFAILFNAKVYQQLFEDKTLLATSHQK